MSNYNIDTKRIMVVDGVAVDINTRDVGGGERKADQVHQELKTHLGRIATAYDEEVPPTDVELKTEYTPLMTIDWGAVFEE